MEKAAVQRQLGHFVRLQKVPRKQDCDNCKENEPLTGETME